MAEYTESGTASRQPERHGTGEIAMSHDDVNGKVNGDLISREALLKRLCEGCNGATKKGCGNPCCDYELIELAPAVDAVEVVHGRWGEYVVVGYNGIKPVWARPCSECGHENLALAHNYCPKCGAKMEERKCE